ncbi:MAG: MazG family protein [Nocardioidaceae bacterium]|nr:MazG family protein [Nocardioidaceae bacterium]
MGRLTVILTSPRLPAGLLTAAAWRVVHEASVVATYDATTGLAAALTADGIQVEALPDARAGDLLGRAQEQDVVWLAADDGDEELTRALADGVVGRAVASEAALVAGRVALESCLLLAPEIEVMIGSFDPPGARLLDLREVMDRLRRDCPWDQEQTHESLVRYLVEETYETIEAVETGDRDHLREELGDLLLQVMFHATIASEDSNEPFDIDDIAAEIVEKLIRRHPHVFADVEVSGVGDVEANWETIKAAEKSRTSPFDGIPPGLPALSLASKVVARSAKADAGRAPAEGDPPELSQASLGDALLALVARAHLAGLDPELALRERVRREINQGRTS